MAAANGVVLISACFEVFGRVQGVWFRKYTRDAALTFSINGWVRNTPRNTVVGCIQGNEENMNKMKYWLRNKGSPKSQISRCEFSHEKSIDHLEFDTFNIDRGKKSKK